MITEADLEKAGKALADGFAQLAQIARQAAENMNAVGQQLKSTCEVLEQMAKQMGLDDEQTPPAEQALTRRADALGILRAPCEAIEDFEARIEQEEAWLKHCATPPSSETQPSKPAPAKVRLHARPVSEPKRQGAVMSDKNVAAVRELVEAGKSGAEIAAATGLVVGQVYYIVKAQGLSLRKRKAACRIHQPVVKSAPLSEMEIRASNRALIVAAVRKLQPKPENQQ